MAKHKNLDPNIYAVAYARYSSIMQNERSIDSQFLEIEKFCSGHNIIVVDKFADYAKTAAGDHENRVEFWKAVRAANESEKVTLFLVSDSSRFFRNREMAIRVKSDLVKHNVTVEYAMSPLPEDPQARLWLEGIYELKDQSSSLDTRRHTLRGQKANAMQRDPDTGWRFKNGGQAPFGYEGASVERGKDRYGKPMRKHLWIPHEENAKWYRFIKVDCRLNRRMSYREIRDELISRNVPTARGKQWTVSSIRSILENEAYLGVYVFNKRDMHHPSGKVVIKPEDEWIVAENAHPPLCTPEEHEAERALNLERKQFKKGKNDGRARKSPWLLNETLRCKHCGARYVGGWGNYSKNSAGKRKLYYICSTYKRCGKSECGHRMPLDKDRIEKHVISLLQQAFSDDKILKDVFEQVKEEIKLEGKTTKGEILKIKKKAESVSEELINTMKMIRSNSLNDAAREMLAEDLNRISEQKKQIEKQLTMREKRENQTCNVKLEDFMCFIRDYRISLKSHDIAVLKRAISAFIEVIEVDDEKGVLLFKRRKIAEDIWFYRVAGNESPELPSGAFQGSKQPSWDVAGVNANVEKSMVGTEKNNGTAGFKPTSPSEVVARVGFEPTTFGL